MNLSVDKYGFIIYHTTKHEIFYAKDIFTKRFSSSLYKICILFTMKVF